MGVVLDNDHTSKSENITKKFGEFYANNKISFEVKKGEVLAILGENGAGKTTLMNILFGHYTPDAGKVYLREKQLNLVIPITL